MATGSSNYEGEKNKSKPTKRNAYVCFILARRQEEENKGNQLPKSMKDLIPIFSQEWSAMDEVARAPYKTLANGCKNPISNASASGVGSSVGGVGFPGSSGSANVRLPTQNPNNQAWRNKKTSQHLTIGEIMDRSELARQHQLNTRMDILSLVDDTDGDPTEHIFVLIDFSVYCVTDYLEYVPAEVGLAAFSLQRGVIDNYSSLIDPGAIPIGCGAESRDNRLTKDLPEPPFAHSARRYDEIMENIDEFLGLYPTFKKKKTYLFCLREDFEKNTGCLKWLCERAGVERKFYLYPYPLLLQTLANTGREIYKQQKSQDLAEGEKLQLGDPQGIESGRFMARRIPHTTAHNLNKMHFNIADASDYTSYNGIFRPRPPRIFNVCHPIVKPVSEPPPLYEDGDVFMFESMAMEFLKSQDMAHFAELACPHHMVNNDHVNTCPLNVVNRFAFNSLDILVEYWGINPIEGSHYPLRSGDREMAKRRTMLAIKWDVRGYAGLQGFEDSIDFRQDDDVRSSSSLSSYTENKEYGVKAGTKGGLLRHSSNSSLDNLSDVDIPETETEPTTADDSEYFGYSSYLSSQRERNQGQGCSTDETQGQRPSDVKDVDDEHNLWKLGRFDGEDSPRRAIFLPSLAAIEYARPAPSFASTSTAASTSTSSRMTGLLVEIDKDGEHEDSSDSKKLGNPSDNTTPKKRIPRIPEPEPVDNLNGEYPHYFDELMWSFGRGVRIPLPEETPMQFHYRQLKLKQLSERKEKFYPINMNDF